MHGMNFLKCSNYLLEVGKEKSQILIFFFSSLPVAKFGFSEWPNSFGECPPVVR